MAHLTSADIVSAQQRGLINHEVKAAALAGNPISIAYTQYKLDGNDGPASPPEGWQAEVTAETLTDEQILQRRREIVADPVRFTRPQRELLAECDAAIGLVSSMQDLDLRREARARIAAAINARRAKGDSNV